MRYKEQLREANAGLARANADLSQLAFATSHDLQEPLRMITSYSQLPLKGYRGQLSGNAATCVDYITDGTKRMRELVADLLAYTQVKRRGICRAGRPQPGFSADGGNCRAVIGETQANVTADRLPVVPGHHPHLVELFQSLIGNAFKYRSERPPRIHVSALKENGIWRLAVADNGIGIDPQYHQNVFVVFKRLRGRMNPGTGIGLAICQRVVERSGGRIWVESQGRSGRASFHFTLTALRERAANGA